MKFHYSLLLLLLTFSSAFAQTKKAKDIEKLTQQWAAANNAQNIEALGSLYAASLNFYALNKDKATCLREKKTFFKKYPNYSISISNLDIDFYKSGIIRCNFIKTEVWEEEPRNPQQGYLLFEKNGNSYHIIAESDNRMDADRGYVPQLGNKLQKSSNITYMLIGAAAILLIGGVLYLVLKKKKEPSVPMLFSLPANTTVPVHLPTLTTEDRKNSGLAFEEYVVKSFDPAYFTLLHWRGDKYVDGRYPLSSMDPDLDYIYKDKARQEGFSVECKWRQSFTNNVVKIAEHRQLDNYRNYAKKNERPVFIVLGIGGTGSSPKDIYIIPLNDIKSSEMSQDQLSVYIRKRQGNFFLEMPAVRLT